MIQDVEKATPKSMFEILCTVLNEDYNVGDSVNYKEICRNRRFVENGYSFVYIKDQIIQYLYLLGKNKKNKKYVKFTLLTEKVSILEKIDDFVVKNYRNA